MLTERSAGIWTIKIVDLYWRRDEQAIKETADKYGAYCFKISMNILSDLPESEENVNDTYMQTWNSIPPNSPNLLAAFVAKIARNLALNKYQAKHAQKRLISEFTQSLSELDIYIPSKISVEDDKSESKNSASRLVIFYIPKLRSP